MQPAPPFESPAKLFSRFDAAVWIVLAVALALTGFLILNDNQMQAQRQTGEPRVLYIDWNEEGADQLMMVDVSDLENLVTTPLTEAESDVSDFSVAPDGRQIVYTLLQDGGAASLWIMNADGRNPRQLLDCPEAACTQPVWFPDGRRLLYERRTIPVPGAPPGNPRLWWLDLETGETVPVFADSQLLGLFARPSPDGRWLSFVSPIDQGIQLYNLENGESFLIPNRMGSPPAWNPQSSRLLMSDIQTEGNMWSVELQALDLQSKSTQTLSQSMPGADGVDDSNPVWSPDGEWIALGRKEPRTPMGRQLWVMRADGSEARALTQDLDSHHGEFAWSPDGRFLLYQRYDLKELYAKPGVWLLNLDTGATTEIASSAGRPAWLP